LFYLLKQKEIYREKYLAESIHDTVMSHSVSSLAPEPKQESDAQAIIDPGRPVSVKGKAFQPMGESASVNATVHGHYGSDTAADERDLRDEAKLPDAEARVVESHSDEDTAEMNNGGKSPFFPESEKTVSAVENPATEDAAISPDELMTGKEAESGDDQVFVVVEDMPTFMNGDISKFIAYVNKSLVYPPRALEAGTEGKVMVRFIVDENGKLIQPEVIGPSDPLLRQEALRVLSSSPRWNAGKQRGKPVKVAFTIPVIFSLEEKKPD
jgi:TonB family protein